MIFEISLYKLKEIFWKNYGIDFIDGFNLAQSPINVIQQGEFKLYDNYADEDIYEELPTLKNLFKENDVIYLYTDHAYQESSIFVLRAKEIKKFLKEFPLDIFSNEPLFISFDNDIAYGYCLEGTEIDSGTYFLLNLGQLREVNKKLLIKKLVNTLLDYSCYRTD